MTKLKEDTRTQLISKSRNASNYKDQSRGKNRFERKKYSKVSKSTKSLNKINMNDFFKKDILEVQIPVEGETNNYEVTIKLEGVVAEIQRVIKSNKNIFEYKVVIQALTKLFNTGNVFVKCTCPDFEMRFKHYSIINNWGADDTANDPGAGKGVANPDNDKGNGCKHILLILNNMSWLMNVASVIRNYILYMAEHNKKAFEVVIFPKLYGIPFSAIDEVDLVPHDIELETEKNIIDTINEWAKNKGKFKAGTNTNPAKGKGKIVAAEETK